MKYVTLTLTQEEATTVHNLVWMKYKKVASEMMLPEDRVAVEVLIESALRKLEMAIKGAQ